MLKTRDELVTSYGIIHDDEEERERDSWIDGYLQAQKDIHSEMYDAAEFSERVSAKLANIHFGTEDCQYCSNSINVNEYCGECKTASTDKHCQDCRMKYARLQVEEEMDAE